MWTVDVSSSFRVYLCAGIDLAVSDEVFRTEDPSRIGQTLWVFMFGAVLATALEFIEFLIVARMSSLTLAVAGICKACLSDMHMFCQYSRVQSIGSSCCFACWLSSYRCIDTDPMLSTIIHAAHVLLIEHLNFSVQYPVHTRILAHWF